MKKQTKKPIIAILGGMGPQASACLLDLLINMSTGKFGVKSDDFPEILLDSVSVPDFISNVKNKNVALGVLKKRTVFLNKLQPSCMAIACNTAHIFLSDLQRISKAPFISMIKEVSNSVCNSGLKRAGILGTPVTIKSGLYQSELEKFCIKSVIPTEAELEASERIVRKIIAGSANRRDKALLLSIANRLMERGTQGIILGCTELPLIFPKKQNFPVFNSLEILASALLKKAGAGGRNYA